MRTLIQEKLDEIIDIDSGEIMSDDIVEDDITYFGYQINKNYINSDMERNYTYRVSIIGYITRRINAEENTTEIVDVATDYIINKLKELNFKCNSEDVSISNNIRKTRITGYVEYNEINNKLIF